MLQFGAYLLFDGNCADAMAFYQQCLGGKLEVTTVGQSELKAKLPPEQFDKVLYARLQSGPIDFSASDWLHPTRTPKQGNTVCLYLSRGTHPELKQIFDKLSAGSNPDLLDALVDMPFGTYGALTDKYGVRWMFQGDKSQGYA